MTSSHSGKHFDMEFDHQGLGGRMEWWSPAAHAAWEQLDGSRCGKRPVTGMFVWGSCVFLENDVERCWKARLEILAAWSSPCEMWKHRTWHWNETRTITNGDVSSKTDGIQQQKDGVGQLASLASKMGSGHPQKCRWCMNVDSASCVPATWDQGHLRSDKVSWDSSVDEFSHGPRCPEDILTLADLPVVKM